MKKENINLLIMIIIIIIPLISIVTISNKTMKEMKNDNASLTEIIDKADNTGTAVIGTLFYMPFAGLYILGAVFFFIITGIVIVITFISILMAILAKSIIKNKEKKVAYRVLMTLVVIPYAGLEIILLSTLFSNFSIILLLYNIVFLAGLGTVIYNTYSNKMYTVEESEKIENPVEVEEEKEK